MKNLPSTCSCAAATRESTATTTEAGFTLFTHLARAPEVGSEYPTHRAFCNNVPEGPVGRNIRIWRWEKDNTAELEIQTSGFQEVMVCVGTELTADQCEALGRALLDAAHDLRTHNSADLLISNMAAMLDGSEVEA